MRVVQVRMQGKADTSERTTADATEGLALIEWTHRCRRFVRRRAFQPGTLQLLARSLRLPARPLASTLPDEHLLCVDDRRARRRCRRHTGAEHSHRACGGGCGRAGRRQCLFIPQLRVVRHAHHELVWCEFAAPERYSEPSRPEQCHGPRGGIQVLMLWDEDGGGMHGVFFCCLFFMDSLLEYDILYPL